MRPLLWKEIRDLRAWLAAGALLAAAVELMLSMRYLRDTWAGIFFPLFLPLLLTVAAVGLGAGQIARERHTGSLDYLLARPVSPGTIVWVKFLAGSAALALLAAAMVALGYVHAELWRDTTSRAIQQQTGYRAMLLTVFPRYWCVYALTLFLSVLVDRSAKVVGLMAVVALTIPALAAYLETVAPFSRFIYWLPFIDESMGLVLAAKSAAMAWRTGLVFGAAALLIAAAAAALLRRSPERYAGNRGVAAMAAGIVCAAILPAQVAAHRLPPIAPVASIELGEADDEIAASGGMAAVIQKAGVRFFEFPAAANPREVAFVPLHLATEFVQYASMEGDTVYIVRQKKDLPVDQEEVAIVRPSGVDELPLGPVLDKQTFSAAVPLGQFLYVGTGQEDQASVLVLDRGSRREVARLPLPGRAWVVLCRRGQYVYAASLSALTAIDVSHPGQPAIASSLPVHPRFMLGLPLRLTWQDDRLLLLQDFPSSLESFSLRDPARPGAQTSLEFHDGWSLYGSGRELYRPWLNGVLAFRADGGGLRTGSYFSGGREVAAMAVDGASVFALTGMDAHKRRELEVFR